MPGSKEIRNKIKSVQNTRKITKAMEMVAASKMRRAQERMRMARPYGEKIRNVAAHISHANPEYRHPFLVERDSVKRVGIIVVTADKGLCGGLNSNVVKAAKTKAKELAAEGKEVTFYLVGKKGRAPIKRDYANAITQQFDTADVRTPGYAEAEAIAAELLKLFEAGKFDVAHLISPVFKSALAQDPVVQQLIPVPAPKAGEASAAAVEYEPDEEEILAELLPRYVKTQLFTALLEREASEQGASMTAMDNATRNAGELINKLTIQYNRSRQAAITTELIEIIAGAEAL